MAYIPPLPPSQTTMANSAPVVIASDQSAVKTVPSQPTVLTASLTVSTSGDNTVIPAVVGKQIKLNYYNLGAKGTNNANVVAILKGTIGTVSTPINTNDYIANQGFAHTIGSGNASIIFDSNTPVVINLSAAQSINFNAEYTLI